MDSISHVFPSYGEERHSHPSNNIRDGMKLKELLNSDSAYQEMDEAAYDVITAFTHATELTNRKLEPNEEKFQNFYRPLSLNGNIMI